ncbi:MAG: hypothetical protein ACK4FB_00210 [Brevundimonas sp.]|uniref:restriction endonuclease subunit S n=1 Tax=Brevundimonas sp. TaxID=1871086 RepID=UPI00391B9C61
MKESAYDSYRESGVQWLGEIPTHWHVTRLKHVGEAITGLTYSPEDVVANDVQGTLVLRSSNVQGGRIALDDCVYVKCDIPDKLRTRAEDILICSRNGSRALIGKNALVGPSLTGQTWGAFMTVFRTPDAPFLYWIMNSPIFAYQAATFLTSTINQLTIGDLNNFEVPAPPASERSAIAAFLNRETSKIDALIEAQLRLIDLLKEKRQAVISHAVTKGLDPTTPMKDSGVEWLGELPAHWKVLPLKRDLAFLTSGSRGWAEHYADEGALFIRIGNLTRDTVDLNLADIQRVAVPPGAEGERTRVKPGDVLFSITAFLGSVAVVPNDVEDAFVSQHVALARPAQVSLLPRWIGYVTLSRVGKTQLEMGGYGGTKVQLALGDVGDLLMTAPPLEEQALILRALEHQLTLFSDLMSEAESAVRLLHERRSALISAAVTGKIDVRGHVPEQVEAA